MVLGGMHLILVSPSWAHQHGQLVSVPFEVDRPDLRSTVSLDPELTRALLYGLGACKRNLFHMARLSFLKNRILKNILRNFDFTLALNVNFDWKIGINFGIMKFWSRNN